MARLTREQLFGAKLKEQDFPVEELGGSLLLKEMPVAEQDKIRDSCTIGKDENGQPVMDVSAFRRKVVMATVVEPKLLPEDYDAIAAMPGAIFTKIEKECYKINGLSQKAEDLLKNSGKTQS